MVESRVSANAENLATCSADEGCAAVERILGAPGLWEPSLISYRLSAPFQVDWKAEVGRWLLFAEQLQFLEPLVARIRKRALPEAANPAVKGANDSAHLVLNSELAAAMAAYYLVRSGWTFLEWEPKRLPTSDGDVDVLLRCPLGIVTDVQVKAPDKPGERSGGQIVGGERDDRICIAVDKGLHQLRKVPGPQRMLVICPQRTWNTDEKRLITHLLGRTSWQDGAATLKAADSGVFAQEPGIQVGAVMRLSLMRGVSEALYRSTVFVNPWASHDRAPTVEAFPYARTCHRKGSKLLWSPEQPQLAFNLPSGTKLKL